ncbi:hypothetical protein O9929_07220 [Vibrio lentus]|nr:hypothetical protein [Vibrio lentus]
MGRKQTQSLLTFKLTQLTSLRKASQNALEAFGAMLPEFMGGSADLAPSNLTMWSGSKSLEANDFSGNYIHYGVREFRYDGYHEDGITLCTVVSYHTAQRS